MRLAVPDTVYRVCSFLTPTKWFVVGSIKRLGEDDQREAQITAASGCLAFQEASDAEIQSLVAEHILIRGELSAVQWAFATTVHLPQVVVLRFYEADVVQIDIGLGGRGDGVPLSAGFLVRGFQRIGLV